MTALHAVLDGAAVDAPLSEGSRQFVDEAVRPALEG